jgi:hypothetical protein
MKNINQIITYCFLSFVFTTFSQTVQFQDFILDGHKLKIDDITWKFQKGDGFSMKKSSSNFDATDSAKVINLFKKVENENSGFHIPSTAELYKLIAGKISIPSRKVDCKKNYSCEEFRNFDFLFNWPAGLSSDDYFKEILKHSHSCLNCKNASKEYQKICPVCKGTRKSYCKDRIICPICDGIGTRIAEETIKTFSDGFKNGEKYLVFYFDSPRDFGLFDLNESKKLRLSIVEDDFSVIIREGEKRVEKEVAEYINWKSEDEKVHNEILALINSGQINEAKNRIEKLNWPNSFPYNKELSDKENSILINEDKISADLIESNTKSQNYLKAIELLNQLHFPRNYIFNYSDWDAIDEEILFNNLKILNYENFSNFISHYISSKYKEHEEIATNEQTNDFINKNIDLLKSLTIGSHEIVIKRDGKLLIDGILVQEKPRGLSKEGYRYQPNYKEIRGISLPVNSKSILNVTESKTLVEGTKKIIVNSKKRLYIKRNNQVYLGNIMNISYNHDMLITYTSEEMRVNNPEFPLNSPSKGHFAIAQMEKSTIFINKIEVGSKTNEVIVREEKMTKRIPKIIWRSISIAFWAGVTYVVVVVAAQ